MQKKGQNLDLETLKKKYPQFMNGDVVEYLCDKYTCYLVLDMHTKSQALVKCPKCRGNHYYLVCPVCETGYVFEAKDKELKRDKSQWYCGICNKNYDLPRNHKNLIGYRKQEIPSEVLEYHNSQAYSLPLFSVGKITPKDYFRLLVLACFLLFLYFSLKFLGSLVA